MSFCDAYNEVNLLKDLKHPGIPIIYDIEIFEDKIYLIEEYVDGVTLNEYVKLRGPMNYEEALNIALSICDILNYLHNLKPCGIVHMDIKPENIMIDSNGRIKLIDFDSAVFLDDIMKDCKGSVGFAAPEQYHRLKPDIKCDIYGFGMVLLFILTGNIQENCIEKIQYPNFSKIIKKCIRHNQSQRYKSVQEIMEDILKENNNKEAKNLSTAVNFIGIKRGVGTTHIALNFTKWLTQNGYKTAYFDHTKDDRIFENLAGAVLTENGTYSMFGIEIIPDYKNKVQIDKNFEIKVCDYGDELPLKINKNEVFVIIGSAKRMEEEIYISKLKKIEERIQDSEKIVCVMNLMSGRQIYDFLKRSGLNYELLRMPVQFDWTECNQSIQNLYSDIAERFLAKKEEGIIKKIWRILKGIERFFREKIKKVWKEKRFF